MDQTEYFSKAKNLLKQGGTYKSITADQTNRQKNILIKLLTKIKVEGGSNDTLQRKIYCTGACAPKFYGLPRINKRDIHLRFIVSSRGTVVYEVAKKLARVLKPLLGRFSHHTRNTEEFIDTIYNSKRGNTSIPMM